jgi:acyl carrier protein
MENLLKYRKAFVASFEIDDSKVDDLEYQSILEWDSVGHMGLIAEIEETFGIQIEADDVIDFSSYEKGKQILKKYDIEM